MRAKAKTISKTKHLFSELAFIYFPFLTFFRFKLIEFQLITLTQIQCRQIAYQDKVVAGSKDCDVEAEIFLYKTLSFDTRKSQHDVKNCVLLLSTLDRIRGEHLKTIEGYLSKQLSVQSGLFSIWCDDADLLLYL